MATNIGKCVHLGELTYWRKTKKLLMMPSHSNHVTVRKRYILLRQRLWYYHPPNLNSRVG